MNFQHPLTLASRSDLDGLFLNSPNTTNTTGTMKTPIPSIPSSPATLEQKSQTPNESQIPRPRNPNGRVFAPSGANVFPWFVLGFGHLGFWDFGIWDFARLGGPFRLRLRRAVLAMLPGVSPDRGFGGAGFLRLLEFQPGGKTIKAASYSPYLDQWLGEPDQQFTITLREPFTVEK